MRKVKRPEHYCSERVFSGQRNDTGGHMCGTPATVFKDGKWWCWRHTKEGKAKQKRESDSRVQNYLDDARRLVAQQAETQRRARLFLVLLAALEAIRDAPHSMTHCRLVEKFAAPAIEEAGLKGPERRPA